MKHSWTLIASLCALFVGSSPAGAASPGAAPTSLNASRATATGIRLRWIDNSTDETGFRVERKTGLPSETGTFKEVAALAANTTTFSDTLLAPERAFSYRVRGSLNGGTFTSYSNVSAASTAPAAPTNLQNLITGPRPNSSDQVLVKLTWQDNSNAELGYIVERGDRSISDGFPSIVADVGANTTTFTDPTAFRNKRYGYRVRAYDSNLIVRSEPSNAVTVVTSNPAAPTQLTATAINSSTVKLDWLSNSIGHTGFTLRRRTGSAAFADIADVGADIRTFNDTNVAVNTTYVYTVVAFNGLGDSLPSNEDSATVLAAPTALTARALNGTQVLLAWSDNSLNLETGFEIFRSKNQFKLLRIATTGANVREFADSLNLEVNSTYFYRLRAKNNSGDLSSQSSTVSVTTLNDPAGMTAFAPDSETVVLRWHDRSRLESGFRIERKPAAPDEPAEWTEIAVVGPNITEAVDTSPDPGTRFTYRVRAFNGDGFSAYCVEWPTLVPLAAPEGLEAQLHGLRLVLTWNDVEGEAGYLIERRVGDGDWEVIATREVDRTRFVDMARAVSRRVRYRIRAVNEFAWSSYSETARAR